MIFCDVWDDERATSPYVAKPISDTQTELSYQNLGSTFGYQRFSATTVLVNAETV